MKSYEVGFSIRGSITIEAESPEQARELLLSADYTGSEELLNSLGDNLGEMGNDVITVDDIREQD